MRTVYKYLVHPTSNMQVGAPRGAKLCHLGHDVREPDFLAFWFEVDTNNSPEILTYVMVETGQEIPIWAGKHVGSFVTGRLVYHVFEGMR